MLSELQQRFISARTQIIRDSFINLNDMQLKAALATEGPLLVLAGAGSGKTTVLIHRIANILKYGNASDSKSINLPISEDEVILLENFIKQPNDYDQEIVNYLVANSCVRPYEILAITFTNKAANELKSRLETMLGQDISSGIWASTFHSACVRILRKDIEKLGYSRDFTIYDTDDSKRVIKECLKALDIDEKTFSVNEILSEMSKAKDRIITPLEYLENCNESNDWRKKRIGLVYREYSKRLRESNALDFDDIILLTVKLFKENSDVLNYYQCKFKYILVDEYQDTNNLQYQFIHLLAKKNQNICVVGDDDQSIYRFRGANIENILNFEKEYKNARIIRLEQNYRSTKTILNASNEVISHNTERKGKVLWTDNDEGSKITIKTCFNEADEANFIVNQIMMNYRRGSDWCDHAILYRINALSNALEYALRRNGIPYKVIGGLKFFDRAEIKDMLAYMALIVNKNDDLRLKRIINNPPRKIGNSTIEKIQILADLYQLPMFEIIEHAEKYPELKNAQIKLKEFASLINRLIDVEKENGLSSFYDSLCEITGYKKMLEDKNDNESRTRLENIKELSSSIRIFIENNVEDSSLSDYLNEIALYTDLDNANNSDNSVILMTIHTAKGLEFNNVFVAGVEEGIFPSNRSMLLQTEIEEERRLCYVAMTRAKDNLYLTCCKQRLLYGRTEGCLPSRFLSEIPEKFYEWYGKEDSNSQDCEESDNYFYNNSRDKFERTPYNTPKEYKKDFTNLSGVMLELKPGECVMHNTFGKGMVLSVRPVGGDALAEIAFDNIGTKKLMLKVASKMIQKI